MTSWRSRHASIHRSRRRSQAPPPKVDVELRKRLSDTAYRLYSSNNDTYAIPFAGDDAEIEMLNHEVAAWMLYDGTVIALSDLSEDQTGEQKITHSQSARDILETANVSANEDPAISFMAKSGAIRLWLNCAWVTNGMAVDAYTVTPAQMRKLHTLYKQMPEHHGEPVSFVFETHRLDRLASMDRFTDTIWGEDWIAFRRALRKQNTLLEN